MYTDEIGVHNHSGYKRKRAYITCPRGGGEAHYLHYSFLTTGSKHPFRMLLINKKHSANKFQHKNELKTLFVGMYAWNGLEVVGTMFQDNILAPTLTGL